jgi:hypothetical protein
MERLAELNCVAGRVALSKNDELELRVQPRHGQETIEHFSLDNITKATDRYEIRCREILRSVQV